MAKRYYADFAVTFRMDFGEAFSTPEAARQFAERCAKGMTPAAELGDNVSNYTAIVTGITTEPGEPDTTDIPEASEDWFKKARLVLPDKFCKLCGERLDGKPHRC